MSKTFIEERVEDEPINPLHISAEALFKCQCKTKELLTSRDTYWKERVIEKDDLLDDMWGLICNVNGGIVENEKEEWYQAFLRIREKYFEQITPITNEDNLK